MTSFASFWKYISVRTAQQQHVDSLAPHVSLQVVKYSLARIGTSSPFARIPRSFIVARLEKHSVVTSDLPNFKRQEREREEMLFNKISRGKTQRCARVTGAPPRPPRAASRAAAAATKSRSASAQVGTEYD
jgi:hypothetical protein